MRRSSGLALVTALLLVLLPTLAVLQYRQVNQLGDAARERMQRNLHNAAQQFRESFDGEMARAFISLQADASGVADERYAERYDAWASTTAYPWLIEHTYVVDARGSALRLRRWEADARRFAHADWEGPIAAARPHFESELAAFLAGDTARPARFAIPHEDGLLLAPFVRLRLGPDTTAPRHVERQFGFTVLQLNMAAVRERLIPALAERYFRQIDDEGYRITVVDASNESRVIYRSSPEAPIDASTADVSLPFFAAHMDPMLFLARGAPGGQKRNVFVSVIRERRGGDAAIGSHVGGMGEGRWRLLAQHGRGSLDAAVGRVRQRNLLISFGILLLIGVSIGLLALSSRRAQQLAHQQMEFVAGVSHELRTPVAVIRSAAENLSHGVVGDPDRVRRYGDAIQTEARRLGEMVERVLHFAGIESGRIAQTPLALEPIVADAIDAAISGGDALTVDRRISPELPLVIGDAAALRSAIQNLIANAVKYGGADGWVRVSVEAGPEKLESSIFGVHDRRRARVLPKARRSTTEVRIKVEDHGPGIAAADLPHVFEPFYRGANARAQQIQGSGLGLALVARIAAAHGGWVGVVTREGEGSAFTLHLPAASSGAEHIPLRSPNEAAAG